MPDKKGFGRLWAVAAMAVLIGALPAAAEFATLRIASGAPAWSIDSANGGVTLVVTGNRRTVRRELGPSGSVSFDLLDDSGALLPDGTYGWEIRGMPVRGRDRTQGGVEEVADSTMVSSGAFTISGGAVVDPARIEPVPLDQVFLDDVIIDGSLCVGQDCVNGESFGFDTERLKENNLRIHFQDTSNSASFPTNDWRLVANDSTNGGASYFAIEDSDAGRQVFRVEAGSQANAIFATGSRVGLGTGTPVVELHVVDGDSPTLRLEQDGSAGFAAQTWDVAGNEAGFFVRDVTNGSTLPFRILPGAASQSLVIDGDNEVGIGAGTNPTAKLHVSGNDNAEILVSDTGATVGPKTLFELDNQAGNQTIFRMRKDVDIWDFKLTNVGYIVNFVGLAMNEMVLQEDGDLEILGMLTQGSSRTAKEDFRAVDRQQVLAKLASLPITEWRYTRDEPGVYHMGPFSEDFHAAFGLNGDNEKGLGVLDVQGVTLAALQGLNDLVAEKDARIEDLEGRLAALEAMMEALAAQR